MSDLKTPFASQELQDAVIAAFSKQVSASVQQKNAPYFNSENILEFTHGRRWENPANSVGEKSSEVTQHSFQMDIHIKEVVAGNPFVVFERVELAATAMHDSMEKSLFAKLYESTAKSGNTVRADMNNNFPEAFMKLMEKMEFSIDEAGELQMPTLFVAPGQMDQLQKQMATAGSDYEQKVETMKAQKKQEAVQREQDRLSKFERRDA